MTIAPMLAGWLALHGCSVPCQAGVLANIEMESGLDPCSVTRSGAGLAQWAGPRRRRFLALYRERWCEVGSQLQFLLTELVEMGLRDRLFASVSPEAAAILFAREFERPRLKVYTRRAARARELYRVLSSQGSAIP